MKYCEDYAALLDPYIDGELSPEDTARVREHLRQCDGCRAYVQSALLMRDAFPEIEDTEVPDGFAESVMGAIRSGAAPQKKRRSPWVKVLVPLAACCAIAILVKSMPMDFSGTDTAAPNSTMTEESTPDTTQDTAAAAQDDAETAQEDVSAARFSVPQTGESGDTTIPPTESEITEDVAPKVSTYTAPTNGESDADQPEAQSDGSTTTFTTTAEAQSWFATLTLTQEQAGTALEDLPADTPVSSDPVSGGTIYWLTQEQFDVLLVQLGNPSYTLEGDGDLARVILLPE